MTINDTQTHIHTFGNIEGTKITQTLIHTYDDTHAKLNKNAQK